MKIMHVHRLKKHNNTHCVRQLITIYYIGKFINVTWYINETVGVHFRTVSNERARIYSVKLLL